MKTNLLAILTLTVILSGCATVKFYSDKELTKESGIEFYSPKPYLIVEKNPAKDVSMKMSIVYLPDFNNPKYAKLKTGFGSSDLKLSLENGIITSYGITSDSKIPETITAIGGLVSGIGTSYKSLAEAIDLLKEDTKEVEQSGDVRSMNDAKEIIEVVKKEIEKEQNKTGNHITEIQKRKLSTVKDSLISIENKLAERKTKDIPEIAKTMLSTIKILDDIKTASESNNAKDFNGRIETYKKEINNAMNKISPPKKSEGSSIEVYEIVIKSGSTELKRIELK
ncbi:MAG: hypothetical protein ACK47E_02495 [Cyclobacteriaceae bacterium]